MYSPELEVPHTIWEDSVYNRVFVLVFFSALICVLLWIAWMIINGIGAFIAYVTPLFSGLATLTP